MRRGDLIVVSEGVLDSLLPQNHELLGKVGIILTPYGYSRINGRDQKAYDVFVDEQSYVLLEDEMRLLRGLRDHS